jgi:ABC-type antimicrobial peptide transport system permease subunit
MATSVSRRSRELGVRLAVGATPGDVSRLVLRDGLSMAVWGSAVGVAIAIWLGTLVEHRLYGVSSVDPISLSAAVALLSAVAMVAAWAPARRAARVDPVTVLRE